MLSNEQKKVIYKFTIDQSKSELWKNQLHGGVTALKFKKMFNIAVRLKKNPLEICPENITSTVMGYQSSVTIWQMKQGLNTEIHAKTKYKAIKNIPRICDVYRPRNDSI